jgi:hypothetical protein
MESVAFLPSTSAKVAAKDQPWPHASGISPKILVAATTFRLNFVQLDPDGSGWMDEFPNCSPGGKLGAGLQGVRWPAMSLLGNRSISS